jgi:NADH:ubiquinone oxidoreductase subunit 3 (subunit A)
LNVEVLHLFPVALAYDRGLGIRDFVAIVIFIGILASAIGYARRKGVSLFARIFPFFRHSESALTV